MAIKLEKVVEKFYLGLEEGKILARKCTKCGSVEFPPVYACNECGSWDMEWIEISGNACLKSIVLPAALSSKPEYKDLGKYCYGEIELEEGSRFNGVIRGVSKKNRDELNQKLRDNLPIKCKASIYQRDGYKTVVFDLVDEE